jgi:ubiquinone/menaquinone biosynthesis C-methylase UbiE
VQSDVRAYYHAIAPFITAELADRGDEAFWRWAARACRDGRVLEIGAGSGRITAALATLTREVVALDISPDMLRLARKRLSTHENVRLLQADMRSLALGETFDLIVAADDPFSHLTSQADRLAALRAITRHLSADGRFVLDALWQSPVEEHTATEGEGRVSDRVVAQGEPRLRIHEQWRCHPRSHTGSAAYEYYVDDHLAAKASFKARYWTADELESLFTETGLHITRRWGSYQHTRWNRQQSRKLIVEAVVAR